MAKRPTIRDLAREAAVSVATVDRVLNGRERVREETARRVIAAAQRLGYHATNVLRERVLSDLPEYRLGFVLRKERHDFYRAFAAAIEAVAAEDTRRRLRTTIRFAGSETLDEAAQVLQSLGAKVQAVAASAIDHHHTTAAVTALGACGVPTFALLSDFAQDVRQGYFGLDNLKVGRSAGWFMARLARRRGKVAVIIGGHRWSGHELRETGFRSYLREFAPELQILETMINLETRQLTREALLHLLDREPDLAGVYVAGGGMEGAITALREARPPEAVTLIVNELTPESRQALLDRYATLVITTPLAEICRALVTAMIDSIDQRAASPPAQRFFAPGYAIAEGL